MLSTFLLFSLGVLAVNLPPFQLGLLVVELLNFPIGLFGGNLFLLLACQNFIGPRLGLLVVNLPKQHVVERRRVAHNYTCHPASALDQIFS